MQAETVQSLERWIRRGLYVILALPVVPYLGVLFPTIFGRALTFMALVVLVAILAIWLRAKKSVPAGPAAPAARWLAAYLAIMAAATFFSVDRHLSFWGDQGRMDGLITWIFAFVFFLLLRGFVGGAPERDRATTVGAAAAAIIAAFAIIQRFVPEFRDLVGAPGERVSGTLGNPILLAGYLAPYLFLTVGRVVSRSGFYRYFWITAALLDGIALYFTQSRGGYLAVAAGGIVFLIALVWSETERWIRVAAATLLVLSIAGGVFAFVRSPSLMEQTTAKTRLINWQIALQGIRERPVLGAGPESFRVVFDRHYRPELLHYSFMETISDKPHNLILEMAVETGLLGLIAYLGTLVVAAIGFFARRHGARPLAASAAPLSALAALVGYGLFAFDTPTSIIMLMFLLALASPERPTAPTAAPPARFPTVLAVCGAAPLIIFLVLLFRSVPASADTRAAVDAAAAGDAVTWMEKTKRAAGERSLFAAENLHHLARWTILVDGAGFMPDDAIRETVKALLPRLEAATRPAPPHFVLPFMRGQMLMIQGDRERDSAALAEALGIFTKLKEETAHQAVPIALARVNLLQGEPKEAVAVLERVVTADPTAAEAVWFYGLALVANGEHARGLDTLLDAERLGRGLRNTREQTYIIDLLAEAKRFEEIVPRYQALIREEPLEPGWHTKLAATYAKLRRPELAIAEAERAIELDPRIRESARAFLRTFGIELP